MAYFGGKRVSRAWKTVLTEARKHVSFRLNSGRRSLSEQRELYNDYISGRSSVLAAKPNPWAPHIRWRLPNHAIDVDMYYGDGEQALQNWLRKHGVNAVNNVAGEGWHIDVPAADLLKLARKIRRDNRRKKR